MWHGSRCVLQLPKKRQGVHPHPAQWIGVAPAVAAQRHPEPLGHRQATPQVAHRPLTAYDALFGVEVGA